MSRTGCTVVATGGYGRGVLAPFSDIDLLFLTPHEPTPAHAPGGRVHALLPVGSRAEGRPRHALDRAMPGRSGARTRRSAPSLLDARRVAGDAVLFERVPRRDSRACERERRPSEFIAAKQAERAARHRRYGDSPFMVEPNVKEGRGGLRDLQTLYWLARYVFDTQTMAELVGPVSRGGGILTETEAKHARRSWEFLWTVRFHLHYVAGRAEERLTFDLQPVVGARMGYTRHGRQDGVERFMRHYFLTVREVMRLTRVLEPAIIRAALGPPAAARRDRQGAVLGRLRARRRPAACRRRAAISPTSRCRCCASCRSRATAISNCTRWRCAR